MSDAGEVAGFVLEATVEALSALGEVDFDSGSKRKKRRWAIATLVIVVAVVIGTVLFLLFV